MRRGAFIFLAGIIVVLLLVGYSLLFLRASEIVPGAISYMLVGRYELIHYDERLQPFPTFILTCPRMDMIRIWPLPVIQLWDEDWWEKFRELEYTQFAPDTNKNVRNTSMSC
jgi:hypothetical protein